jgi:hypothetical protein
MKKLLPFLIVPIMFSCVSKKKYAELESQNSVAIDYSKKLDEILQMRTNVDKLDQNMENELRFRQLKEQMVALKTLNQLAEEGSIKNMNVQELQELIRKQSKENAKLSVVSDRDKMKSTHTRKSIEKEAIAMLISERIVQNHPSVSVSSSFETCIVTIPNSALFGIGNSVSTDGLNVLQNLRQTADFREGIKITVKLPILENEIKDEDRKKANSILEGLMNVSTRMQKDISLEFSSEGKAGDIVFDNWVYLTKVMLPLNTDRSTFTTTPSLNSITKK